MSPNIQIFTLILNAISTATAPNYNEIAPNSPSKCTKVNKILEKFNC